MAHFPSPANIVQIFGYKYPDKRSGWIEGKKQELKTIIDILCTIHNKKQTTPNYVVVSTTEADTVKLDQDDNVDILKARTCVRGDLQKK
jgi:hypothetical protein